MGAIPAIAFDAVALEQALASFDGASWSLLAATAAALGLWLWGRQRLPQHGQPMPARAASFAAPTRSADLAPPTRTQARPRLPDLAALSSLLRAPPGTFWNLP